MVLFYHRVADTDLNSWTISTDLFRDQVKWIGRNFRWATLSQICQQMEAGAIHEPLVHLTFDDGYAENMEFALPLLSARRIPFTYFVSTNHVWDGEPFPHDARRGRPLAPNTREDLRTIVEMGGEIGAHSRSHADLGRITSSAALADEILGSQRQLAQFLGRPVQYFAFPFGQVHNITQEAMRIARQAGFRAVCSAFGGYNFPGDDSFHIRRIHGDSSLTLVKNWLTLDPRKLAQSRRLNCALSWNAGDGRSPGAIIDADVEAAQELDRQHPVCHSGNVRE
jgi:peptidoglycan/xylan/chitin deacetylase (PgdA/CDA1 family)